MEKLKKTVGILGAGAMGTAMAYLISKYRTGKVKLWDRDSQLISEIQQTRVNLKYSVPEIRLPQEVSLLTDLEETIERSDLTVLAIPSFAVRPVCQRISDLSLPPLLMISKGMEKETSLLPFQVVREVLGKQDILHITGVGFAKEIHKEEPFEEALASEDESLLENFETLFEAHWLTIETTTDLLGAQLGGALKNVMVVGIGLAEGEKESPEMREKLIEEGVREMIRLGKAMGAKEKTFEGPAGRGDLQVSADPLSRNYRYGKGIYQKGGERIKRELQEKNITVEGFHTAWAAYQLAKKYGVRLPIIEEVYRAIYGGKNPKVSAGNLRELAEQN